MNQSVQFCAGEPEMAEKNDTLNRLYSVILVCTAERLRSQVFLRGFCTEIMLCSEASHLVCVSRETAAIFVGSAPRLVCPSSVSRFNP